MPSANLNKSLQVANSTTIGIIDVAGITKFRIESTFFYNRKFTVVDITTAVNIFVLLCLLRDIEIIRETFILQKSGFSITFCSQYEGSLISSEVSNITTERFGSGPFLA